MHRLARPLQSRRWIVVIVTWLLVAMGVRTGFARVAPTDFAAIPKASDWAATGHDCTLFAIADIDGDGFGDLLTVNGARQLCVAYTVEGWKASRWQVLAEGMPENVTEIRAGESGASREGREVIVVAGDRSIAFHGLVDGKLANRAPIDLAAVTSTAPTSASPLTVDPPPFEPTAPQIAFVRGDVDGDGRADAIGVFKCSRPHDHMVVRLTLAPREGTGDLDGDGLSDEVEARLGTDPLDRDTDDDGLLDGWEVAPPDGPGMPRGIQATLDAQGVKLDPRRQDVLVLVSRYEQLDETTAKRVVEGAKPIYAKIKSMNPDGSTGISLQVVWDDPVPKDQQGNWSWGAVGNARLPRSHRGIFHWMQITPGGGGQAGLTGDMGGCGAHHAAFAHELGHQLSLTHEGDSAPAWCPLYPSMMNYAFNYALGGDPAAIGFSDGKFSAVELNESALVERLPFKYEDLKYLAAPPFRFTLKPDGDGTLIDWNHNGVFDSGTVKADINYGGSTYCGTRHIVEVVGGAPALAYVGPTCVLATVEPNGNGVALRACEGDGKWSAKRMVPASATGASTRSDPVMVGGPDAGFVFVRNLRGWHVARFSVVPSAAGQSKVDQSNVDQSKAARPAADQPSAIDVGNLAFLVDLPACDLSAARVDGRVLLVSRHDDELEARWFDPATSRCRQAATTSAGVEFLARGWNGWRCAATASSVATVRRRARCRSSATSKVPVGVAADPARADRRIVMTLARTRTPAVALPAGDVVRRGAAAFSTAGVFACAGRAAARAARHVVDPRRIKWQQLHDAAGGGLQCVRRRARRRARGPAQHLPHRLARRERSHDRVADDPGRQQGARRGMAHVHALRRLDGDARRCRLRRWRAGRHLRLSVGFGRLWRGEAQHAPERAQRMGHRPRADARPRRWIEDGEVGAPTFDLVDGAMTNTFTRSCRELAFMDFSRPPCVRPRAHDGVSRRNWVGWGARVNWDTHRGPFAAESPV
ncbi:MAG: hypothetical protein U0575_07930 [Phycisphaerales bacterium]